MSENNYAALMMKRAPTNSESWNNIKDPGIYPIAAGHPSAPDGAAGVLFVMPPKSGATQDFISTSKKRYTRTFNGSSWLVWSTGLYVGDFGLGGGSNHKADAYNNVGEIYRVNSTSANTPTTGVAGVISLPCDGGPSTAYVAASNDGSAWIGYSSIPANGVKWNRVYTTAYKPTALDTGALPLTGGTCTGQIIAPNFASTPDATPVGSGTYSEQLNSKAPFFQANWQWPVTSGGVFVPIAKGKSTRKDKGWPTAISYGYLMPGEDMHAHPVIHALGDNGMENIWDFDTQTGGLRSGKAGEFATQNWVNSRCPFPVGYFMLMGNHSDPNVIYPGTEWQDMTASFDGRVLSLGFDALGTGGSNTVTLGVEHMPPHSHNLKAYHSNTSLDGGWSSRYSVDPTEGSEGNDVITSTGGGNGFNVTNAYVHVRGWMRTA